MVSMKQSWPAPPPQTNSAVDAAMQERLARLASRRAPAAPTSRTSSAQSTPPVVRVGAANTSKRRHAAQKSRVAALAMSVSTTVGLSAYFFQLDASTTSARAATAVGNVVPSSASQAQGVAASASHSGVTYTDGVYSGQTSNNRWGPVQVQVTVSGGQVTDIAALQTPGGNGRSAAINDYAVPILRSEALQAQTSTIDSVSGATYTSNSYMASLQSALDVARAQTAG